jgi:hypothetical protein
MLFGSQQQQETVCLALLGSSTNLAKSLSTAQRITSLPYRVPFHAILTDVQNNSISLLYALFVSL